MTVVYEKGKSGGPEKEPGKCGAKIRKSDPPRYCRGVPVQGKTRCRFHGGKSLAGIDHPRFKHGEYSRYMSLPPKLRQKYERALSDPKLLDARPEVAMMDALTSEALSEIDLGASAEWMSKLKEAWAEYEVAKASGGTPTKRMSALAKVGTLITSTRDQSAAREEAARLIERRDRIASNHVKRMRDSELVIPIMTVAVLLSGVRNLIWRYFENDEQKLNQFKDDFERYIGPRLLQESRAHDIDAERDAGESSGNGDDPDRD